MYTLFIFLPFISAILSGLFGRYLGQKGSQYISTLLLFITSCIAIIAFYEVGMGGSPVTLIFSNWIDSELLVINWGLYIDSLTVSMGLLVTLISTCVHLYSIGYMEGDPHKQRFFSYLSLFTFFMLVLVSADNFLLLFVGWEGIGICSYLLINFWYTQFEANKSAMLALLMNRVGDLCFSIGLYIMFLVFGSLSFSIVFSSASYIHTNLLNLVLLPLFIGAMAKSSQLGLNTWLPQAMAGPTPVSALLHSATMVTAGVYLLIRISPILELSSDMLIIIIFIGSITALSAAFMALTQSDIKKIIAYSTMSQLGYTFIACGISQYDLAIFHILNHGFFKALLFLSAGAILHSVYDEQNIFKFGGFIHFDPLIYIAILTGSFSLMAFPFLTGYYSKDFIIISTLGSYTYFGTFAYLFSTLTALITCIYSIKLICLVYLVRPNGPKRNYLFNPHFNLYQFFILLPISILTLFSIFFGYFFKDLFIGFGSNFWNNSLFISFNFHLLQGEFLTSILTIIPTFISLFSIPLFFIVFYYYRSFSSLWIQPSVHVFNFTQHSTLILPQYFFKGFFSNGYWLDAIYASLFIRPFFKLSNFTNKIVDQGFIESFGPFGLTYIFSRHALSLFSFYSPIISFQILFIVISIFIFILLYFIFNLSSIFYLFFLLLWLAI